MNTTAWQGFQTGKWTNEIDVRNFIQKNYTLYEGDDTFLEGVTDRTQKVWDKCHELILEEMKKGILDVETNIVSGMIILRLGTSIRRTKSLLAYRQMRR